MDLGVLFCQVNRNLASHLILDVKHISQKPKNPFALPRAIITFFFAVTESQADTDRWSCIVTWHQLCQGERYDSHGGSCTACGPTHDTKNVIVIIGFNKLWHAKCSRRSKSRTWHSQRCERTLIPSLGQEGVLLNYSFKVPMSHMLTLKISV